MSLVRVDKDFFNVDLHEYITLRCYTFIGTATINENFCHEHVTVFNSVCVFLCGAGQRKIYFIWERSSGSTLQNLSIFLHTVTAVSSKIVSQFHWYPKTCTMLATRRIHEGVLQKLSFGYRKIQVFARNGAKKLVLFLYNFIRTIPHR